MSLLRSPSRGRGDEADEAVEEDEARRRGCLQVCFVRPARHFGAVRCVIWDLRVREHWLTVASLQRLTAPR
eukprot:2907094-Pyramimonas_sp.AAC.1